MCVYIHIYVSVYIYIGLAMKVIQDFHKILKKKKIELLVNIVNIFFHCDFSEVVEHIL